MDGGTCLSGKSDIFIHCKSRDKKVINGQWSEWTQVTGEFKGKNDGMCNLPDPSGRRHDFDQWQRTCEGQNRSNEVNFCEGHWLKLKSCPNCGEEPENNEDYNEEYGEIGSDSGSYSYDSGIYTDDTEENTGSSYNTSESEDQGFGKNQNFYKPL